jgi:hypothetical protein
MESSMGRSTFRELRSGTLKNLAGEDNKSVVERLAASEFS